MISMSIISMSNRAQEIYKQWEDGKITDREALEQLGQELQDMRDEFAPAVQAAQRLEQFEKTLRTNAEHIVRVSGGPLTNVGGFTWRIVETRTKVVWDTTKLDTLMAQCLQMADERFVDIAGAIADARDEKPGTSYMRVEKVK